MRGTTGVLNFWSVTAAAGGMSGWAVAWLFSPLWLGSVVVGFWAFCLWLTAALEWEGLSR